MRLAVWDVAHSHTVDTAAGTSSPLRDPDLNGFQPEDSKRPEQACRWQANPTNGLKQALTTKAELFL